MNNSVYGKTINAKFSNYKKKNNNKMYKNDLLAKKGAKILFQKLPFYNVLIEKPRIKSLKT